MLTNIIIGYLGTDSENIKSNGVIENVVQGEISPLSPYKPKQSNSILTCSFPSVCKFFLSNFCRAIHQVVSPYSPTCFITSVNDSMPEHWHFKAYFYGNMASDGPALYVPDLSGCSWNPVGHDQILLREIS